MSGWRGLRRQIQTRTKYFLSVPWIYRKLEDRRVTPDAIDDPQYLETQFQVINVELDDFEKYVYQWYEAVETYQYAIRRVFEEKDDVSFDSSLELVGEEDEDGL